MALSINSREVSHVAILDIHGRIVLGDEIHSLRDEVRKLVGEGKSLEEIARIRECKVASVVDLVASMVEGGAMVFRAGS